MEYHTSGGYAGTLCEKFLTFLLSAVNMNVEAFIISWVVFAIVNNAVIMPEWNNECFFVNISVGLFIGFIIQTVRVYRRKIR